MNEIGNTTNNRPLQLYAPENSYVTLCGIMFRFIATAFLSAYFISLAETNYCLNVDQIGQGFHLIT